MARTSTNPRYNILSCRVDDNLRRELDHALGGRSVQDFLHDAIREKIRNDYSRRFQVLLTRRPR